MGRSCAINGCNKKACKGTSFFRLPTALKTGHPFKMQLSSLRRQRWLDAIERDDLTDSIKIDICQNHFISKKPADLLDQDNPDWVPNLKLGSKTTEDSLKFRNEYIVDFDEYEEEIKQKNKQLEETKIIQTDTKVIQTDLTMPDIDSLNKSHEDFVRDICNLKSDLKTRELNEDTFRNDDTKTRYYTGLNSFSVLMTVYELVSPSLKENPNNCLAKFQQFLLTLMRLRLNLDLQDLAYRFSISKPTAGRVFYMVLDVLYARLKGFIVWPDRDNSEKKTLVIDSFDVDIEKASNSGSKTKIGFSFRGNNVVKYFIGVCPEGTICFINEVNLGEDLDEDSGSLVKYDFVLPYHKRKDINFKTEQPASKKRKKQKSHSEEDIEEAKELVGVRKHVYQIMRILKQRYRILDGRVPIVLAAHTTNDDVPCLDKIITVTSALVNMCPINAGD